MTLYPGSYQVPAMLISKAPAQAKLLRELASGKYIAQKKMDGAFYQLEKTKDGTVYLFGRSKSKKTGELSQKIENVPHIKEWADENLPNDSIVLGEVYYPGGKSNDTTKIMGSLPKKAIERQRGEYGMIHFYIHDILRFDGKDFLESVFDSRFEKLQELDNTDFPHIEFAEGFSSGAETFNMIGSWIASGLEGAVLKLKSGLYVPGKRPVYNFKIKEEQNDIDVIITKLLNPVKEYTGKELDSWSYFETYSGEKVLNPTDFSNIKMAVTKPYFYGWKNAVEVSGYKNGKLVAIGTVSSGITDEMKADMAMFPDKYIGQVCELQAMSWTEDGALRHPRFIRMRPDKNAEECVL